MNKYTQTRYNRRKNPKDRRRPRPATYRSKIIIGLLVLFILVIQFFRVIKTHKPWQGPETTSLYATLEKDGSVLTYALLPNGKMVITKSHQGRECVVFAGYQGVMGSKLFGNTYHIKIRNNWNWREHYKTVEPGAIPVTLRINSLEARGDICSSLPLEGRPKEFYFEFNPHQMKLKGSTFIKLLDPKIAGLDEKEVLDYFKNSKMMH